MPCHVKMVDGHCDDGFGYLVRSNALNTEREVHKTLQLTVHDSMTNIHFTNEVELENALKRSTRRLFKR